MATRGMYTTPARLGATHVALCIGNCKYEGSPLKNAANDAQDVAALCTKLGFSTELVLDATLKDMLAAVRAFGGKLPRGGVGLFFYAGAWGTARAAVGCHPLIDCFPRPRRGGEGPELPHTDQLQGGGCVRLGVHCAEGGDGVGDAGPSRLQS